MIENYDKAVDSALERGESVEDYLDFKTKEKQREADHVIAMNQQANARMAELTGIDDECLECGHAISLHADKYGCDFEGDRPDADIGQVAYRCGCKAIDELQALLYRCWQASKKVAAVLLLLVFASVVRADSLSQGQVAQQLTLDSVLPLAGGVATELADNLLDAQAAAYYTQFEPDSLQLSIDCVLKAIGLYVWPGGPSAVTSEQDEPIVWEQSRIAVDDRVSVSLSPTSIDFGDVPVNTPEPSALLLLLLPLIGLAVGRNPYGTVSRQDVETCIEELGIEDEREKEALRKFYERDRKQDRAANIRLVWAIVKFLGKCAVIGLAVWALLTAVGVL